MSELHLFSLIAAALTFIAGAIVGGVVDAAFRRYEVFREAQGVASAIRAEIDALVRLARFRQYVELSEGIIARLQEESYVPREHDVFAIQITQDYFSVFNALSPKIGLLGGSLASSVVLAYASTKSWFEDIAQLRERTLPFLDGSKTIPANEARTFLLSATRQINGLLKEALEIAVSTSAALESFAARRWLGGCSIRSSSAHSVPTLRC